MAVRACLIAMRRFSSLRAVRRDLLGALHIELNSFRIAGGIMLFLIALDMVFESAPSGARNALEKVRTTQPQVEDVSVFPMAMPMLAGPGSIASVMLLTAQAKGYEETLVILGALGAVMLLSLHCAGGGAAADPHAGLAR